MVLDYYKILGVNNAATDADVKRAYHKRALRWHPDKNPSHREEAERRFKQLAEAYEALRHPLRRAVYDLGLKYQVPPPCATPGGANNTGGGTRPSGGNNTGGGTGPRGATGTAEGATGPGKGPAGPGGASGTGGSSGSYGGTAGRSCPGSATSVCCASCWVRGCPGWSGAESGTAGTYGAGGWYASSDRR